jgi:hypothetical protein
MRALFPNSENRVCYDLLTSRVMVTGDGLFDNLENDNGCRHP